MMRYSFIALLVSALAATECRGADKLAKVDKSKLPPPVQKQNVTYAADVQPIFEQSCVKCHGTDKPKAKLRLDSREGALKGSEHGKVLVVGKSDQSLLIINVAHLGNPDDYMPPPKNKAKIGPLTPEQIGLIRAWIDQGAN